MTSADATLLPTTAQASLVITNIAKRSNVRSLLKTAAAFGCENVYVVGQNAFDFDPAGPDVPGPLKEPIAAGKLQIIRFDKWDECVEYLQQHGIRLVGVEIHKDALSIERFLDGCAHDTSTTCVAFLMGNEGTGLNEKHLQSCDAFVRIPQFGDGTASLNVYVAASIVLHRFHSWQRQQQRQYRCHYGD